LIKVNNLEQMPTCHVAALRKSLWSILSALMNYAQSDYVYNSPTKKNTQNWIATHEIIGSA
jgi:hypothetical protein